MKKLFFIVIAIAAIVLFFLTSCKKDELSGDIGGNQSPIGEVGNTITWQAGQFGISETEMYVSKLEDGVSTFVCSATTTNIGYIDLLKMVPTNRFPGTINITGNTVEATVKAKITDEGVQVIFNDGSKLTLVKYNAEVGDKFSIEVDGITLENEVIEKSSEDDFFWGGMYIKVIKVRYNSHSPGISYVEHIYNHKFGLVSIAIHFEDGSVKYAGAQC